MQERTDQQWLEELTGEDIDQAAAYTDLFYLLFRRLYGYIQRRRRNIPALDGLHNDEIEQLAAGYAQDTLLRIWQQLDSYNGTGKFIAWAFVVAKNIAREAFRRKRWSEEIPTDGRGAGSYAWQGREDNRAVTPDEYSQLQSMLDDLGKIIKQELTQRERICFVLHYLCDWPSKEVAKYLHVLAESADQTEPTAPGEPSVTVNAVNKTLHRARRKIASTLIEAGYILENVVDLPAIAWKSVDTQDSECPESLTSQDSSELKGQIG